MANGGGGLYIDIAGGVRKELLQGLASLRANLVELAKVAKQSGNVELGRGIDKLGKSLHTMAKNADAALSKAAASAQDWSGKVKSAGTEAAQGVAKTGDALDESFSPKQQQIIQDIRDNIEELDEASSQLTGEEAAKYAKNIALLHRSLEDLGEQDEDASQDMKAFANKMDLAGLSAAKLKGHIKMTSEGFRALDEEGEKVLNLTARQSEALKKSSKGYQEYTKYLRKITKEQEQGSTEAERYINAMKTLGKWYGTSGDEAQRYTKFLNNLQKHMGELATRAKSMGKVRVAENLEKIKPTTAYLKQLNGSLKVTKNSMEVVSDEARTMFKGVSDEEFDEIVAVMGKMPTKIKESEQMMKELRAEMDKLEQANHEAFDSEDTRKWKSEISTVESKLKNIKKYVPDEEFDKLSARISEARRQADRYAVTMKKAAENMDTRGQRDAMLALSKQYGDSTARINKYKKAIREVVEFDQRRMDQILTKIDRLRSEKTQTAKTRAEVERLTREYDDLANETGMTERVQKRYKETLKGVAKGQSYLNQKLDSSRREMGFLEQQIEHVSRRIKQFGAFVAAAFVIRRIQMFFRDFFNILKEFDQALYNLQAIMKITSNQVIVLGEAIKNVARSTKFSATEVAEGVQTLGQAGLSMQEAMYAIEGVTTLATGTLSDFQVVSDLATTTLNAFNFAATESTRIADIFANAINNSKLSVDKLKTAFNYVGAAGKQVGLTLNELTGTLMTLADNGLRASTMGTGLRRMMLKMVNPAGELVAELRNLGETVDSLNPKVVGWQTALKNLTPVLWDSNRETVNMAKAAEYFGTRAAQVAAVLVRSVSDGSAAVAKAVNKTYEYGSAAEMAEKQIEGLGLKTKNLADRLKLVIVAVGEAGATGALKDFIDVLREAAEGLESFISQHKLSSQLVGIGTSVLFVTSILSGLAPVIYRAVEAWKALRVAHLAFFKSLTFWTVGLTTLIFSLNTLVKWHYKAAKAAGENAQEHSALADAFREWGKTLTDAFDTSKWDNAVKRFEDVEIAGKNLSELLTEELGVKSLKSIEDLTNGVEVLQRAIDSVSTKQLNKQFESSVEQMKSLSKQMSVSYTFGEEFPAEFEKQAKENLGWFGKLIERTTREAVDFGPNYFGKAFLKLFGPDQQELLDEFRNSLENVTGSVMKFAELSNWDLDEVREKVQKNLKILIDEFGEGSVQVNEFREAITQRWFDPALVQTEQFVRDLSRVRKALKENGKSVEWARDQLSDYAINWKSVGEDTEAAIELVSGLVDQFKEDHEELFQILQEQWSAGESGLEEALKYIREEMELSDEQMERLIYTVRRMDQEFSNRGRSMFSNFLSEIERISPTVKDQLEDLTDAQQAALYKQRDQIYEAGDSIRKAYESVFGASLEDIDAEPLKFDVAEKLKEAGFDARTVDDMFAKVKEAQAKALNELLQSFIEKEGAVIDTIKSRYDKLLGINQWYLSERLSTTEELQEKEAQVIKDALSKEIAAEKQALTEKENIREDSFGQYEVLAEDARYKITKQLGKGAESIVGYFKDSSEDIAHSFDYMSVKSGAAADQISEMYEKLPEEGQQSLKSMMTNLSYFYEKEVQRTEKAQSSMMEAYQEGYEARHKLMRDEARAQISIIRRNAKERTKALLDEVKNERITWEQYEQEKQKIVDQSAKEMLNVWNEYYEKLKGNVDEYKEKYEEALEAIKTAQKDLKDFQDDMADSLREFERAQMSDTQKQLESQQRFREELQRIREIRKEIAETDDPEKLKNLYNRLSESVKEANTYIGELPDKIKEGESEFANITKKNLMQRLQTSVESAYDAYIKKEEQVKEAEKKRYDTATEKINTFRERFKTLKEEMTKPIALSFVLDDQELKKAEERVRKLREKASGKEEIEVGADASEAKQEIDSVDEKRKNLEKKTTLDLSAPDIPEIKKATQEIKEKAENGKKSFEELGIVVGKVEGIFSATNKKGSDLWNNIKEGAEDNKKQIKDTEQETNSWLNQIKAIADETIDVAVDVSNFEDMNKQFDEALKHKKELGLSDEDVVKKEDAVRMREIKDDLDVIVPRMKKMQDVEVPEVSTPETKENLDVLIPKIEELDTKIKSIVPSMQKMKFPELPDRDTDQLSVAAEKLEKIDENLQSITPLLKKVQNIQPPDLPDISPVLSNKEEITELYNKIIETYRMISEFKTAVGGFRFSDLLGESGVERINKFVELASKFEEKFLKSPNKIEMDKADVENAKTAVENLHNSFKNFIEDFNNFDFDITTKFDEDIFGVGNVKEIPIGFKFDDEPLELAVNKMDDLISKGNKSIRLSQNLGRELRDAASPPKFEWNASSVIKQATKDLEEFIRKQKDASGHSSGGFIPGYNLGGFIEKFAPGGKLPGFGGGDIVKAMLEPGEFVVRKEAVQKYGSGLFHSLNQMKLGAENAAGSIRAKLGAMIPKVQAPPAPRFAYQTGGSVEGAQSFGKLDLSINKEEIGPIYANPSVLKRLEKEVKRENRLRRNN